jgi:hypothetical protein
MADDNPTAKHHQREMRFMLPSINSPVSISLPVGGSHAARAMTVTATNSLVMARRSANIAADETRGPQHRAAIGFLLHDVLIPFRPLCDYRMV